MINPLVSIIVVCYNHVSYVEQCIQSIVEQTYKNIEIIVADDCSTDGSVLLLEELTNKYDFIFLPSIANQGLNSNILKGLDKATGAFIAIIASDDYLVESKIEKQMHYLIKHNKEAVFSTGFAVSEKKISSPIKINKVFSQANNKAILNYVYQYDWGAPLLQSGLFKKTIFFELIPIRKDFKSDDWAFLIKCYELYNTGYLNEPLFYYRLHATNTHKRYWFTFPMRLDIAARLVPKEFKTKSFGNIMLSQGQYLVADGKLGTGLKFFMSSICMNFSLSNLILIAKSITLFIINKFSRKA